MLVIQSCLTLCNPMDRSPPGSSVHWILQARILEWVAILFTREYFWPKDRTWVSFTAGRFFTIWATREKGVKIQTPRKMWVQGHSLRNRSWYLALPEVSCTVISQYLQELLCHAQLSYAFGGERIHVCVAESLCCPPKTITALQIDYTSI